MLACVCVVFISIYVCAHVVSKQDPGKVMDGGRRFNFFFANIVCECVRAGVHAYVYKRMCVCAHACKPMPACVCVCMSACVSARLRVSVHVCARACVCVCYRGLNIIKL